MSLLFVVPLLLAYEGGRFSAGPAAMEEVRNEPPSTVVAPGRRVSRFPADYAAPGLVLGVLLAWSFLHRHDRPRDLVGLGIGMTLESAAFAGGLYLLSQAILPVFDGLGIFLHASAGKSASHLDPQVEQVLRYLAPAFTKRPCSAWGSVTLLYWLFQFADFSPLMALNLAATASAVIFAGAHHLQEPFHAAVFLYRCLAGFYFAWIYQLHGLGVAVEAHTGYNLLIGLLIV